MKVAAVLAGSLALGAQAASLVPTNFTACRATRCTTSQGHVMTSQPFDIADLSQSKNWEHVLGQVVDKQVLGQLPDACEFNVASEYCMATFCVTSTPKAIANNTCPNPSVGPDQHKVNNARVALTKAFLRELRAANPELKIISPSQEPTDVVHTSLALRVGPNRTVTFEASAAVDDVNYLDDNVGAVQGNTSLYRKMSELFPEGADLEFCTGSDNVSAFCYSAEMPGDRDPKKGRGIPLGMAFRELNHWIWPEGNWTQPIAGSASRSSH